ncbi:MAG: arsenic metallochaperone ArsD family protein, partial [Ruoffia tabacinasalis]
VRNQNVIDTMQNEGQDSLPITVLDEEIVKTGAYPTNEEISEYLGIQLVKEAIQ